MCSRHFSGSNAKSAATSHRRLPIGLLQSYPKSPLCSEKKVKRCSRSVAHNQALRSQEALARERFGALIVEVRVRRRLAGGGRWIRTVGPPYEGNDKRAECHIFKRRTGAEVQVRWNNAADRSRPARGQQYRILPPPTSLFGDRPPRWGP
jgi:hypothetical protein